MRLFVGKRIGEKKRQRGNIYETGDAINKNTEGTGERREMGFACEGVRLNLMIKERGAP